MEMQSLEPHPLDFTSAEVQGEIFKTLKRRFERAKRQSRRHTSLDQTRTGADGEWSMSLVDFVPAEEHSDPLRALLRSEDWKLLIDRFLEVCRKTYSQFSAYLVLMAHFEGEREAAADYLAITAAMLDLRMGRARVSLDIQCSLFDGLAFLDLDFWPRRGMRKAPAPACDVQSPGGQLMLFEANAFGGR